MGGGVIRSGWAVWILAGLGVVGGLWNRRSRGGAVFLLGLLAVSLLALSAGLFSRTLLYLYSSRGFTALWPCD